MNRQEILNIINNETSSFQIMDLMRDIIFKNKTLDLVFYKYFYSDLSSYTNYDLVKHYYICGINENRIPNRDAFKKLFPDFVLEDFRLLYDNECCNKNEYQIMYHYSTNYKLYYPNLNSLYNEIEKYDLNLHYALNEKELSNMNYLQICLHKAAEIEKNEKNKEVESFYNLYNEKINEISKIFNFNKNFEEIKSFMKYKKKKIKNFVFNKETFYKNYPDFDFNFYSKQIYVDNVNDLELYCMNYFLKYGLIERHFINEEIFRNFFFLKNLGDDWLEIYKLSLKSKSCTYLILNNFEGGSYKYFLDLVMEYGNNYYKVIKNQTHLNKINFKENDTIFIQYVDNFSLDNILEIKNKFNLKVIVSVHDFYWLTQDFNCSSLDNHIKYQNFNIEQHVLTFLKSCTKIICPSKFVYEKYLNLKLDNLILVRHNDFNIENHTKRIEIKNKTLNLAVLTHFSVYKGRKIYEILRRIYHNQEYNGYKINILTIGNEIDPYEEKEFFDFILKYNINSLLYLNNYGETWSYSLSKGLKTGLPILYNNIGSFIERITPCYKYQKFFENENKISKFLTHNWDTKILERFESFLDVTIKNSTNNTIPIYKNDFNFALKTSFFYDSLFKKELPISHIDFYLFYDPEIKNYSEYHFNGMAIEFQNYEDRIEDIFNDNICDLFFIITPSQFGKITMLTNFFKKNNYLKIDNSPVLFININTEITHPEIEKFKESILKSCKENIFSDCIFVFNNYHKNKNYNDKMIENVKEIDKLTINYNNIQSIIYNENLENKDYENLFTKLCANYKKNGDKLNRMFLINCNKIYQFLGLIKSLYSMPLSL